MTYYRLFHCAADPFPPAGEQGYFFPTSQHGRCLDLLQGSIRERRGLAVCYGDADTGKTMLFHELVEKFRKDDHCFLVPIADPHCQDIREFIDKLSGGQFTIPDEKDPEALKGFFKEEIIQSCAVEKKAAILLIDRGQNLPGFALEYLGELYNHQLNVQQLLQIVILARPEFKDSLQKVNDLTDHLHCEYFLKPLSFGDVRHMVLASFQRARTEGIAENPFDIFALAAIHFMSRGNPRLVREICRFALLSLVTVNRKRADFLHVMECCRALCLPYAAKVRQVALSCVAVTVLLLIGLPFLPGWDGAGHKLVARFTQSFLQKAEKRQETPAPPPSAKRIRVKDEGGQAARKDGEPSPPQGIAVQPEAAPRTLSSAGSASPAEGVPALPVPAPPAKEAVPPQSPAAVPETVAEKDMAREAPIEAISSLEGSGVGKALPDKKEMPGQAGRPETLADSPPPPSLPPERERAGFGPAGQMPSFLGEITTFEHETLGDMIRMVYGPYSFNRANTDKVLASNPHLGDRHLVKVGERIKFPVMAVGLTPRADKVYWLHFVNTRQLQEAYRFLRIYMTDTIRFLIIPSWDGRGNLQFSIFLQHFFETAEEAERHIARLSAGRFPKPVVMEGLTRDRFFFVEKKEAEEQGRLPEEKTRAEQGPQGKESQNKKTQAKEPQSKEPQAETSLPPKAASPVSVAPQPAIAQKQTESEGGEHLLLGSLAIPRGETLGAVMRRIYGPYTFKERNVRTIAAVNPHLRDLGNIPAGTVVKFPAIPVRLPRESLSAWHVELLGTSDLAEVYPRLAGGAGADAGVFLVASRGKETGKALRLFLASYFRSAGAAEAKAAEMRLGEYPEARVVQGIDAKDYVFTVQP